MNKEKELAELIEYVNSGKLSEQWRQKEKLQAAIWQSIYNQKTR